MDFSIINLPKIDYLEFDKLITVLDDLITQTEADEKLYKESTYLKV